MTAETKAFGARYVMGFSTGEHIDSACDRLHKAAVRHGEASGKFNDIEIIATADDTVGGLVAQWQAKSDAAQEAYRRSPKGIKAREEAAADLAKQQSTIEAVIAKLPALDWSDDVAILDWICSLQEPSDRIGVSFDRGGVVREFADHGFLPSVNCDKDFNTDDRDNVHRFLVGQALDGLQSVGAIHPMVRKFADDWKAKFLPVPALLPTQEQ